MILFACRGQDIPEECSELTHPYGQMRRWMRDFRGLMEACVMRPVEGGQVVAWCAFHQLVPFQSDPDNYALHKFNIGTFTHVSHRNKGYGRIVLRHALMQMKQKDSLAIVRYGGSSPYVFNSIYHNEIVAAGLEPEKYFG